MFAATQGSGNVHRLYRNDGLGIFSAAETATDGLDAGASRNEFVRWVKGMAIADADGDGLMDIHVVKTGHGLMSGTSDSSNPDNDFYRQKNEAYAVKRSSSDPGAFQPGTTGSFGASSGVDRTKAMAFGDCEPVWSRNV